MNSPKYDIRASAISRSPRRLRNLLKHGTPKRWLNFLLVELEMKLGRTKLRGRPYIAFIDPINLCNLRCPLCPTGTNDLRREQGSMDFRHFKLAVDQVAPWAFEVTLYNWGEPLLHKRIFDMISYVASKNLATSISSNFNHVPADFIDRLIDSGLEHLTISLDGASPAIYSQYRVRGEFERVIDNLRSLVDRKRERGTIYPLVEWQFIVMQHNQHEIPEAQQMALELGVDMVTFIPVALPFATSDADSRELSAKWFSSLPGYSYSNAATAWTVSKGPWRRWFRWGRRYEDPTEASSAGEPVRGPWPSRCYHLYRSITVNPGGGVAPCCIVYDESADTGSIEEGLAQLWNNETYLSARSEFTLRSTPSRETICSHCTIFAKPRTPEAMQRPL